MFLAVALVALNTFFWLAQGGFAIRRRADPDVLRAADGPRRGRVPQPGRHAGDERIDRGVIMAVTPALITLHEADGTTAAIPIAATAQVQGGRIGSVSRLRRGLRVVVYHQANAPADSVQVEGIGG